MTQARVCSIIVPAYNVEAYVAEALDSALAQTYAPIEIVVVDDGSTDSTPAILDGYTDDRIVRVTQENRGLAAARNAGLAAASGEFVALLDADDVWEPGRLRACIDALDADPGIVLVTTDAYMIDGTVRSSRHWYGDFSPADFPPPEEQLAVIADRNFLFVSVVLRREWIDRVGGFDEQLRRSEDYDMWTRLLLAGATFALVREPLAWCRLRPDSLIADRSAQWSSHLAVLEKHLAALHRKGVPARGGLCFEVAERAALRRDLRSATRHAALGLRARDLPLRRRLRATASLVRAAVRGRRGSPGGR